MSSLPETSVWEPAELRADAVPASPAPSNPPQFEVSTSAGVPERLLRPARAAAHAAGYAAGWADGMHAAKARAEVAAEQARAELDARQAEQRVAVQRGLAGLDAAAERLERIALPGAEELESVLLEAAFGIAEALVGHALRDDEKRAPAVLARVL
ncbi:MAG TPA: hypothetical protein VE442_16210, partial [Jatrophihabitans sp.]|nr:hypothetical protein [Jatrophihabitans sp.]